ncbi:MAG: N-glycosylase/DNA lyase [Candidatus Micrarchaeota archaeon]
MDRLLERIISLKTTSVGERVRFRMREFYSKGQEPEGSIFNELCFCLLTANYSAEGAIRIQSAIGDGFITLPEPELAFKLKSLGYRFPNARARYIAKAREHHGKLKTLLKTQNGSARDWLADNVLGLGYKEASHFLRNVGKDSHAIIDFHIIDILAENRITERPKTLTRKKYLEIERVLATIAERAGINQGELDLYLWYLETGKILK